MINKVRSEVGKVWFSSIESSIVRPQGAGDAGAPPAPGPGPVPGRGRSSLGVASNGFTGIVPKGAVADAARRGAPAQGQDANKEGTPPPKPNGYRIFGYAKDTDTIYLLVSKLKEQERFRDPGGKVYFNEATVEPCHISELEYARTGPGGAAAGAPGGQRNQVTSYPKEETIYYFRLDLQFAPPPGQQQAGGQPQRPQMPMPMPKAGPVGKAGPIGKAAP